jgi:hypothetical protein
MVIILLCYFNENHFKPKNMKRVFAGFTAIIITAGLFAQVPLKMSYQAVIRDADSKLVKDQEVGMKISILQGSPSGTLVYTENHAIASNGNGLVSIEIGGGNGFDTISWHKGPFFLKTETDPAGGTNFSIVGITQLLSVPYSLYAKTAGNISGAINEKDPLFKASVASGITSSDTSRWNAKVNTVLLRETEKKVRTLFYLEH